MSKQIKMTSADGVTLYTGGKYVEDDIHVIPDENILGSSEKELINLDIEFQIDNDHLVIDLTEYDFDNKNVFYDSVADRQYFEALSPTYVDFMFKENIKNCTIVLALRYTRDIQNNTFYFNNVKNFALVDSTQHLELSIEGWRFNNSFDTFGVNFANWVDIPVDVYFRIVFDDQGYATIYITDDYEV